MSINNSSVYILITVAGLIIWLAHRPTLSMATVSSIYTVFCQKLDPKISCYNLSQICQFCPEF